MTGTVDLEHELVIDPDLAWSTYLGAILKSTAMTSPWMPPVTYTRRGQPIPPA